MKIATLTYPQHQFIDLAPLAARYEVLAQAVLTFVTLGRLGDAMRVTQKVRRLIRTYARFDTQNVLWARKLEMLCDKAWRECVLKELGGVRKLRLWEAARERILARGDRPASQENAPTVSEPSWLFTPERITESERLKAHARKCARAAAQRQPNVFRDRVKMDCDGMFRLPPLPRMKGQGAQVKVYMKYSIEDYDFNAVPFAEEVGFGPAIVWPIEFYAAAALEARVMAGRDALSSVIPDLCLETQTQKPGPNTENCTLTLGPGSARIDLAKPNNPLVRDDSEEKRNDRSGFRATPLHLSLDPKTYRDFFENPI